MDSHTIRHRDISEWNRYRGVLFDLDGTLLDTLADLADATNSTVQQCGYATHPMAVYKEFVSEGAGTMNSRALPSAVRTDVIIGAALKRFLARCETRWKCKTRPYPSITTLCNMLA